MDTSKTVSSKPSAWRKRNAKTIYFYSDRPEVEEVLLVKEGQLGMMQGKTAVRFVVDAVDEPSAEILRNLSSDPNNTLRVTRSYDEALCEDMAKMKQVVSAMLAKKTSARDILKEASDTIGHRASERDKKEERSMAAATHAFNALTGHGLSETQGWLFMVCLKASRSQAGAYKADDWLDMTAYAALAAECEAKENS